MTEVVQHGGGEATARKSGNKPGKARGLGCIYQRGETWWIQYSFRGRLYRESSGSSKPVAASKLLKRRLGEIGH